MKMATACCQKRTSSMATKSDKTEHIAMHKGTALQKVR